MDEQNNLAKYINRVESSENFRKTFDKKWTTYYKRWRNYVDDIIDPDTGKVITDRSNISIPYTFTQVETILPRLIESLFASRPYVAVKGRTYEHQPYAESMETLLDWQMNERIDIKDEFRTGLKVLAIYGTTVAYVGWKLKEKEVIRKEMQPVMIDGQPVIENGMPVMDFMAIKTKEIEYDDPEVKFIDLGLFFVDPHAEDIEDARYCGHIEYKTKDELKELAKLEIGYKFDWDKIPQDNKQNEARNYRMGQVGLPTTNNTTQSETNGLYEVIHYWEDNRHVAIINRSYIALDVENPFWHKKKPYVKDTYNDAPHEFYGIGVVEIIEDLQDELNAERNSRIDYRSFNLRRMFKKRRGANINPKELKWRQGGVVHVDDMQDLEVLEVSNNIGDSFSQEQIIKQDIRDTSGAHDVVMGTTTSKETATSTMTKDNNASIRFKDVISSVEKRLLVGIAKLMIALNQQFVDDAKVLRIAGEDGDEWHSITPEQIQGEFDLIPMGSSVEPLANKEVFKQRMVNLYNVVANDQLMQQFPDKRRNLLKKVIESFDIKDIDNLLPTDEELQAIQTNGSSPIPAESISFKDLPPAGQVQMAAQAGIQLQPSQIQSQQPQGGDITGQ